MDPATMDSLNTAVGFQGAMLGRHEQELFAARHAVETLAAQVSDLSGQFQSLRLVPPATSWSSESPEPRVNNPPCYSGQPTECRSFLTQCDIVFSLQPNTYSSERARIAYVISLLTGRAREWGTAIWEARAECSNVYQNFKEEMIRVFDRSVFGKEASRGLASLCQGDRSITDYSIEFRTLAASSDWNEPALLARFLEGLHAEVKDEILSREVPSSVDSLIALAIRIERRVDLRHRARGRELALTGFPFSASQPSPSIGSETEPMQLGGIHISTKERERRITNRLCFYCGSAGHFVMSCPVKGQSSSVSGGLLVSATTQVSPSRSCTTLLVHLRWTGSAASCSALIDSGAEGCFMDEAWARKHDIPLRELGRLTPMFALDGSPLPSIRCETLPLTLTVSGNHSETISFLIFCSPVTPVVLGHPWLEEPGDVTGVPEEYHDLRTVFSRSRASSLPPHRSYDCCIDLLPGTTSPRGRLFSLSAPERKALEDYLSAEGIQMDPAKVQDVSDWPVPKSRVELQRFLGFANFFRRFIRNFGQVAAPLTVLTSVKSCFKWSGSAQGAFDFLKKRFTSAPILVTPDVTKQFIVEVDVSEVGVGAILSQRFQSDEKVHPCAYFSHRLSPSERNYDVGNRELLAIRLALGEWRQWLEGATVPFVVWTDHKNLEYIRSAKRLNARQARWALFFARFEFEISYRPGNKNTKPDALSRLFSSPVVSTEPEGILPEGRVVGLTVWGIERQVKQALTHTASPRACPRNLLFAPVSTRLAVLQWAHSAKLAGHPGVRGTLASIRQRFWWPTQERDTRRFVAACSDCAQTKSGNSPPAGRLRPLPIPSRPWSQIALDFITGLPSSAGRTVRAANRRRIKSPRYCRGQRVWLSTRNLSLTTASRKLTPRFIGPFRVSQVVNPVAVRLLLPRHLRRVHPVFHVSCVKPFLRAPVRLPSPPPVLVEGAPIYKERRIMDMRSQGRGQQYLVDGEGFGPEEKSWVPSRDVLDRSLIDDFLRRRQGSSSSAPGGAWNSLISGMDLLFYTITEGKEMISVSQFVSALRSTGLWTSDPRLRDCMRHLRQSMRESAGTVMVDQKLFRKCVGANILLLTQAFRRKFIIPDFEVFASNMDQLYYSTQRQEGGHVADYIPQLAKFSPDLWGVSLCTVDGQRHSAGDTKVPFCLQSCVKPLEYAIAVHEIGTEHVHRYVGKEPSGLKFNQLSLNDEDKPHNPMVNAGAIVISSLLKPNSNKAERFDYVTEYLKKMAGTEYVGFSNATFQSEKETGDRNFAIGYYLKEKKCFPENADMIAALDFYFQLCSIEVTCESGCVMAATLANGGICPITGERVLSAEAVRNTLSLMHSCGMYDFSGRFAFHVGLPAKSGVSGAVLLVVPNIMGIMCWSPPLDRVGNSVRGIHFCQELVSLFNFHNYDNLRHFARKLDPRRLSLDDRNKSVVNLMFAAYSGDVSALRRFALSAVDMEEKDYDSRTGLHVASAEGHVEAVIFLTEMCKVNPHIKDRWGNTPLDDARQFGRDGVVSVLTEYQQMYLCSNGSQSKTEDQRKLDTVKVVV
ncbi:uncharacterized protein ACWYII_048073 isoform 2-T2 [Salvelinus alpinus]